LQQIKQITAIMSAICILASNFEQICFISVMVLPDRNTLMQLNQLPGWIWAVSMVINYL